MKYISSQNEITVFWLYDEAIDDATYFLYLDGQKVGETKKSFYTFFNLACDKEYCVEVYHQSNLLFKQNIKTAPKKHFVKIDLPSDGSKILTKEIQKIIDFCGDNDVIFFPKGTYLTGALYLHSNMEIYLDEGATIQGSSSRLDYLPKIKSRFEGIENESYASLINIGKMNHDGVITTSNIYIHGKGSILGGGKALCDDIIGEEIKNFKGENSYVEAGRNRNRLINISSSENVIIEGLHLGCSSSWNIHPIYSNNIYIFSNVIESYGLHNGDGIDPDSSHDVYIFGNTFDVGDDCVAIKSGKNPEGNKISIPSYNIYIFDCYSIAGHGCSIGSEISGGIYNIDIFNSDFRNTYHGLQIKTTRKRGAYVKNIRVKNCSFASINIHTVPYNDDGESSNHLTDVENIDVHNVVLEGIMHHKSKPSIETNFIKISGFEEDNEAFNDISITDVSLISEIKKDRGIVVENASNVTIKLKEE